MMHMEQRMAQTQTQRLMLTQKMQQAIQILQLSGLELEQYVQQEMETNPVLDQIEKKPEPEIQKPEPNNETDQEGYGEGAFDLDEFATRWLDRHAEGRDLSINRDADERRAYYENSITKEESFSSYLLTQMRIAVDGERRQSVGEYIIGEIDGRGYFTGSLEEIAAELDVPLEEAEEVLRIIQRFDPLGVGARDVVECLLIQIDAVYPGEEALKTLVRDHLTELERRQIPKIAKAMDVPPERIEELRAMLAKLNPWPGLDYTSDPPQYIAPDVYVEKIDDDFIVYLSGDHVPSLRLNEDYRKMAKNGRINREEKQYLRDKVESARWLIRNIEQRQQTILRIARAIVEVQRDFLEKGVEFIRPLTLQEIADRVGVHEATVSRTTRGKYIQTPQGLFELKYFFSPGLKTDSGENQSSKSVQMLIKKMIDEEDKKKPLSDQKIADLLKKQGLNIARRTVTKYREALDIPATTMRREYS